MKIITFSLMFAILLAATTLANGLEISDIRVSADYDQAYVYKVVDKYVIDRKSFVPVGAENDSRIKIDAFPGSNVTFTVRVGNTFKGDGPELRNIIVRIRIQKIDDGSDLKEESQDFNVEPENDQKVDIKFKIPLNVDASTYNTIITAEGIDGNRTKYSTEVNLKLPIKKEVHDIRIKKVTLEPSTVDCKRGTKLSAEIVNTGPNQETQVALEFKALTIGINSYDNNITINSFGKNSDREINYTKSLNIDVPSFFSAGTYPIYVNLYWNNLILFDQKVISLTVKDCAASSKQTNQKQEEKKEQVTVIQPTDKANQIPNNEIIIATQESFLTSPVLLSVIAVALIISLLAIFLTFNYLIKSRV